MMGSNPAVGQHREFDDHLALLAPERYHRHARQRRRQPAGVPHHVQADDGQGQPACGGHAHLCPQIIPTVKGGDLG